VFITQPPSEMSFKLLPARTHHWDSFTQCKIIGPAPTMGVKYYDLAIAQLNPNKLRS